MILQMQLVYAVGGVLLFSCYLVCKYSYTAIP